MNDLWMFVMALVAVYLIPGPDMVLLIETSMSYGRRKALAVTAGLGVARVAHVTMAAIGLAALFKTTPWAYELVRLLGATYLIYLGARILLFRKVEPPDESLVTDNTSAQLSYLAAVCRGLLTNLLNPKALLFCSVLLPQFLHPSSTSFASQFALLGMILVTLGLGFDLLFLIAGRSLGVFLSRGRPKQKVQNFVFASLLIGLGTRLALDSSR